MIQQEYLFRHQLCECPGDVLVSEEVRALYGVPGVERGAVALLRVERGRGAALGSDAMAPHELYLAYDSYVELIPIPPLQLHGSP